MFTPLNAYLYVFEYTGCSIACVIDTIKPIQMALETEGGRIFLISSYWESQKKDIFWISFNTKCGKIKMTFELTKSEYIHNLDFFGGIEVCFDDPIKFGLDNNKFKLP